MYALFFEKKTEPKQMHVAGCYDRSREKFSRPLRDAVTSAIFFQAPFSYEKNYSVALLFGGTTGQRKRWITFDIWRLVRLVVLFISLWRERFEFRKYVNTNLVLLKNLWNRSLIKLLITLNTNHKAIRNNEVMLIMSSYWEWYWTVFRTRYTLVNFK